MSGVEIPNGSVAVLNATVSGVSGSGIFSGSSADAVVALINSELVGDGLTIGAHTTGPSGIFFPLTGEFNCDYQIVNQSGQELDESDLVSQFVDAVQTLGGRVTSAGVTEVRSTSDGQNAATGSHGNVTTTALGQQMTPQASGHVCGDPSWGFFDDPMQFITCLTSKGLSTVGLLAIGLLIGIILIVGIERRPTPV